MDRRTARREATKAEIVQAAWMLARETGVAALSLHDLAIRVGMRAPSLYSYFPSKNAIYDAMYAEGFRAMAQVMDEHIGAPPRTQREARAVFKQALRAFAGFCVEDPARYQLLFQRTIPGFEPSPESFRISLEQLMRVREHLRAAGVDDDRALDLWTALATGLVDQQISNDPGGDRWLRLIDDAVDMFFDHVGSRRRGRTR